MGTARLNGAARWCRAGWLALLPVVALGDPCKGPTAKDWQALWNGRDLGGWTAKIRGFEAGDNAYATFRVEDGLLTVSYADYDAFDEQFGHLFYNGDFSHYRLRLDYRFVGDPMPDTADWAVRNSGIMFHAQPPATMPAAQDFPISLEFQFLGGLGDGKPRPTGSLCTPGTHVDFAGHRAEMHCITSSAPTFDGNQWVHVELLVEGGGRIVHFVNGVQVIEYANPVTGGGVVSGHHPAMKPEGVALTHGYIALQSEGHPVQFRRIELLDLGSCRSQR